MSQTETPMTPNAPAVDRAAPLFALFEARLPNQQQACSAARYTVISQNLGNSCPDIIAPVVEDGTQDRPTPGVRWVKHGSDVLLEWWCSHRGWVEIPFVPNAHISPPNAEVSDSPAK